MAADRFSDFAPIFDDDRTWLGRQPRMNPWEEACAALNRQLTDWLIEYSEPMCDHMVTAEHDEYGAYVNRMWNCWSYHWRQAVETMPEGAIDGQEVARTIRSGQGYQRGGRLGGDPLRDIVLAVAVSTKDNRATDRFQADYFEFSRGLAGKVHRQFYLDSDEWWNEFVDFLAGYTRRPGKLDRFKGKCALRNWLGTVLWSFLRRRPLPKEMDAERLEQVSEKRTSQAHDLALAECLALFTQLVKGALDELPAEDRLVLGLIYVDGLKLKEAAIILGVHSGNAGRQRERAMKRLHGLITEQATNIRQQQSYQECMDQLAESPKAFADVLYDALEKSSPREVRS